MKRVLIYAESEYPADAINLLDAAGRMYSDEPYETYTIVINNDIQPVMGWFDVILQIEEPVRDYDHLAISDLLTRVHEKYCFDSILIPATKVGRLVAPMAAMKMKTGLVADVTEVCRTEKEVLLVRPAYSGRIMAGITVSGDGPVMLSVRPGVFEYEGTKTAKSKVVKLKGLSYRTGGIRLLRINAKVVEYDIRESNILISGGGGVSKNFEALKPLAEAMGGHVSASRAVVDKGIVPRSLQVGQSGKSVSPGLYIALGISGAVQHVAGLNKVNYIISVNTNRNAPICSMSDIVVEGDAVKFIERLVERINRGDKK